MPNLRILTARQNMAAPTSHGAAKTSPGEHSPPEEAAFIYPPWEVDPEFLAHINRFLAERFPQTSITESPQGLWVMPSPATETLSAALTHDFPDWLSRNQLPRLPVYLSNAPLALTLTPNADETILYPPEKLPSGTLAGLSEFLERQNIVAQPGFIETEGRHILRLSGADAETIASHIQQWQQTADAPTLIQRAHINVSEQAPKPESFKEPNRVVRWLDEHAPWVRQNAGLLTGGLYMTGALGMLSSALRRPENKDGEEIQVGAAGRALKLISALGFVSSSAIIMRYVRQPGEVRETETILDSIRDEWAKGEQSLEQMTQADDAPHSLLGRAHETLRRYPWETTSLINLWNNFSHFTSSVFRAEAVEASAAFAKLSNAIIRIFVPQRGGKSITDVAPILETPSNALASSGEALMRAPLPEQVKQPLRGIGEQMYDNPIKFTSKISASGDVLYAAAAVEQAHRNGTKLDKGLAINMFTGLTGNFLASLTSKGTGIGFDELVSRTARYLHNNPLPGLDREQSIQLAARQLSKQPEILHHAEELAAGIERRLNGLEKTQPAVQNATAIFTDSEREQWAAQSPFLAMAA